MQQRFKLVLAGGGTAGHVTPNIALMESLGQEQFQFVYIGSAQSIESKLITRLEIPFYAIQSGKLRRQLTLKNLLTPFKVLLGIIQAFFILLKVRPDAVFSKGGFVAFPVVFAAWLLRIPVIAHESDFSPGLANRMSYPFVQKICITFEKGKSFFKRQDKVVVTGTPIRKQLFSGERERAREMCGFLDDKPVVLLIGGSQGSQFLNQCLRDALPQLLMQFNVIHLCGQGKRDPHLAQDGYKQFEYLHESLADCLALADIVISRAGANVLYELLSLKKVSLLVPLSRKVSRGDQLQNAAYFSEQGYAESVEEEALTADELVIYLQKLLSERKKYLAQIEQASLGNACELIKGLLLTLRHIHS